MKPVLVTAPINAPVSLAELKEAARVDVTDEDTVLQMYLDAAVAHLDGYAGIMGRAIINQSWRVSFAGWPVGEIALPFGDVSGAAVKYFDADDAEQTLSASLYEVVEISTGALIRYKTAFSAPTLNTDRSDAVQVTFTTGFGANSTDVPAPIKVAIMLLAAHWYENREAVTPDSMQELPIGVDRLITPYRRVFF